jgi:hypothetical protein
METNNIDVIRQAVLFTKQNNLVYKKVYAASPITIPFYAIKVISVDPAGTTDTAGNKVPVDWDSLEQDKDYYVTTFLSDGTEDWKTWQTGIQNKNWFILSATETRQKGTKNTGNIPNASQYYFKKEFLETEVSMNRPVIRPFGFLENFAVPGGSGTTGGFFGQWRSDRDALGLANRSLENRFMGTPSFGSTVGTGNTYKGTTYDPTDPSKFDRKYDAAYKSSNLIQKHFFDLGDKEKITLGWSGGSFDDWWEDSYSSSASIEEGEFDDFQSQDNSAAVATFNQEVPLKSDYSVPSFRAFYFDKKKEFDSNPDEKKGTFKMPLPTEDEMTFYGLSLMTFYELGLESKLTSKEVDTGIISELINKIMDQLKVRQNIDDINDAREKAKKDALERAQKSKKNVDTGANILTNLFKRVES